MMPNTDPADGPLPALPLEAWRDTYQTLHMWTQVVGKIRLALSAPLNHWWHIPLYLTARGLTTSPMYSGEESLQIDFDLIAHALRVESSRGTTASFPLEGHTVASFYGTLMAEIRGMGIDPEVWQIPVEVEERTPFSENLDSGAYDPLYARRFWEILRQVDRVTKVFRGKFRGKASPVHFFWGSFDLAATRFCGRGAPPNRNAYNVAPYVMEEAYSAECSSCGFWPGEGLGEPAFYAYHYPEPDGYAQAAVQPAEAYYHPTMKEFILPYEAVRRRPDWEAVVLDFYQSTYEAGANLAQWDRDALEQGTPLEPENRE